MIPFYLKLRSSDHTFSRIIGRNFIHYFCIFQFVTRIYSSDGGKNIDIDNSILIIYFMKSYSGNNWNTEGYER